MLHPDHIALFVGSDVTAHLVMNKVVPQMIESGYKPIIFLPEHKTPQKGEAKENASQYELREAAFYERTLTNQVVYPFLEVYPFSGETKNLSPKGLAQKYGLDVHIVPDVNDPSFVNSLRQQDSLVGGLSIRCFQIFKPEIISLFRDRGFFLNLHPGILPKYQGVMSTVRAMAAEEKEYGWTLHEIDENIDTGDILWVTARKLDLSKTGLLTNVSMASIGAESITRALEEMERGNVLKGHPQDRANGRYYSYPTPVELNGWLKKGIRLGDAEEIKAVLVDKFSDASTRHGVKLGAEISHAIDCWKEEQKKKPAPPSCLESHPAHPVTTTRRRRGETNSPALGYGT